MIPRVDSGSNSNLTCVGQIIKSGVWMKKVLTAIKLHRTESFVHEETVIGTQVERRSERKSCECLRYAQVRFESGALSDPPTDSEIDPCEGLMDTIPRLRGDRAEERGA